MNALSLIEKLACLAGEDKIWLERIIDRLLASPAQTKGCNCHVIDPKKSNIIIWPSKNPKHANDLIVKFTDQRMIAMPRVDKRGEKYWKVRDFYENEEEPEISSNSPAPESPPEVKKPMSMYSMEEIHRINKFRERQAQALNAQAQNKSMSPDEYLAQLAKEKAEREAQAPKEEVKENANQSTND